jgi:hypothetical protein
LIEVVGGAGRAVGGAGRAVWVVRAGPSLEPVVLEASRPAGFGCGTPKTHGGLQARIADLALRNLSNFRQPP